MKEIEKFNNILQSFKIQAQCLNYQCMDNYQFFDIKLLNNCKVSTLKKYQNEIALALKTNKPSIKILHEQGIIRLEFSLSTNKPFNLLNYFTNTNIPTGELICLLGKTVDGQPLWMNLQDNPHMLIAGTTGSGKTVLLHNIIANIYNYNNAQLYLIDPKHIEFYRYEAMPNTQVFYTYNQTIQLLDQLLFTMENRYQAIRDNSTTHLPPIVLMIDEFADLILQDENDIFYNKLCRLAQKCRAAKIHIVLATQRPSVNIINGTIKANFSARIACKTASHIDSRVIIDSVGAEHLKGKGDALLRDNNRNLERFQIAYIEPQDIVDYYG